jgi:hypothetical protein
MNEMDPKVKTYPNDSHKLNELNEYIRNQKSKNNEMNLRISLSPKSVSNPILFTKDVGTCMYVYSSLVVFHFI